jgi:hypothetical protein
MSQESVQVENAVTETAPVLRITISDVLGLLDQGKSRKEIAEHYGRTQSDMKKMVWDHPKLKNRKAKKQYTGIELEDDTEDINDVAEVPTETVVETEVAEGHAVDASIYTEPTVEDTVPDTSDWN